MLQATISSVETRTSWVVAGVILAIMAIAFGAPWITVVALKDIAAEVDGQRSIPAFASALMWIGSGIGGILMGRIAERIGVRWTVAGGGVMIAVGLAISTLGPSLPLYVGHGLFIGLIGIGGINAPCYVYVSRWFDRRRGSALALISSGAYLAGAIWPPVFARFIAYAGWRQTMLYYAAFELLLIVPAALLVLAAPPDTPHHATLAGVAAPKTSVLGWPPNLVFGLQMCAIFTCCVPMSMPQAHLVALCTDNGISAAHGAAMVSVLLGCAFFSRQAWGAISDRIGGLYTMLAGSACQALGMLAFLLDAGRGRAVHRVGLVRSRLQRARPCQCAGLARALSGQRSLLADADIIVVQRLGHGGGRLDCRRDLRPFRLLRAGFCHRARRQSDQSHDHRRAVAAAPADCARA